MNKSTWILPALILAGLGVYFYMKNKNAAGGASGIASTNIPAPGVSIAQAPVISTTGLTTVSAQPLQTLGAPNPLDLSYLNTYLGNPLYDNTTS